MKASLKKRISLLVISAAFCAFLINMVLTSIFKDKVFLWLSGPLFSVFVAYLFAAAFSKKINEEIENFYNFTKNLDEVEKIRTLRAFNDDLFMDSAKNVINYITEANRKIENLTKAINLYNASKEILNKCAEDMKGILMTVMEEERKSEENSNNIFNETEVIKEALKNIENAYSGVDESLKEISDHISKFSNSLSDLKNVVNEATGIIAGVSDLVADEMQLINHARSYANKATEAANEGVNVVSKAVSGMNNIVDTVKKNAIKISDLGKSSDEIGEIIATIDEIADQTNLLALNAAIEAARAGEQGRGFAVVADEIRKLAERTTKATKEIADTINAMQEEIKSAVLSMEEGTSEVERGVILTDESGKVLNKIMESINRTNETMAKLDELAKEQSVKSASLKNVIQQVSTIIHDINPPSENSAGQNILSEKSDIINSSIENVESSLQNIVVVNNSLRDSLERIKTSSESLDILENRIIDIIKQNEEENSMEIGAEDGNKNNFDY